MSLIVPLIHVAVSYTIYMHKPKHLLGRPPGRDPIYRRLAAHLRREIETDAYPAGQALPSIRAIAIAQKVGVRVVRLAVEALKAEGIIEVNPHRRLVVRTKQAPKTHNGHPVLEIVAQDLRIALTNKWLQALHRGIRLGAGDLDLPLLSVHRHSYRSHAPFELADWQLKGAVLYGPGIRGPYEQYQRLRSPSVLLDVPDPQWQGHLCCVDNAGSACEATGRLIAIGHRRIAFVRLMVLWRTYMDLDSEEREKGFLQAFRKAGLPRPRGCFFNTSGYDRPGSPPLRNLLAAKPPFTAVLATDPRRARLVMETARQLGISIPADLSVVCFQSTEAPEPEIAGPRIDFQALGRRAVQLLRHPKSDPQKVRLPAAWQDAETIAPPR